MIPHFVLVITPNDKMIWQTKLLLKSLEQYGNCNYHCTIFILKGQKISDSFLIRHTEIKEYDLEKIYNKPWSAAPRWNVNPKSPIVVPIDSDVVVLNDINPFLNVCSKNKIYGVIAAHPPFQTNIWQKLYNEFEIKPKLNHKTRKAKIPCPFYINHGVIAIAANLLPDLKTKINAVLPKINHIINNNYFISQVATTLAISLAKIEYEAISPIYNSLTPLDVITSQTVFYHYCYYNRLSFNELLTKIPAIAKEKMANLFNVKTI